MLCATGGFVFLRLSFASSLLSQRIRQFLTPLCFYSSAISPLFTFVARVALSHSLPVSLASSSSPASPLSSVSPASSVSPVSPASPCRPCLPRRPRHPCRPCRPHRLRCPRCPHPSFLGDCSLFNQIRRLDSAMRRPTPLVGCSVSRKPSILVGDCGQQCVVSSSSFPSPVPRSRLQFLVPASGFSAAR